MSASPEGAFVFEENEGIGEWQVKKMKDNATYKLDGTFSGRADMSIDEVQMILLINCKITGHSVSGAKVDKVTIWNGGKPMEDSMFKGAKCVSYAKNIEMRIL